jgi:hypothetical protein
MAYCFQIEDTFAHVLVEEGVFPGVTTIFDPDEKM